MRPASLAMLALILLVVTLTPAASRVRAQTTGVTAAAQGDIASGLSVLMPTRHPPLPRELSQVWLVPTSQAIRTPASSTLATAGRLMAHREYSKSLTTLASSALREGQLGDYATYYAATAHLALLHAEDALRTFKSLRERKPIGYLTEAAALGEARVHEALNDPASAVQVYETLIAEQPKLMKPDEVYMRLGLAARASHQRNLAADAFGRVFYEFPLSDRATDAAAQLAFLFLQPAPAGTPRYQLDLGRAERLFGARRYSEARGAYVSLRPRAADEDRLLIALRTAECDYYLKRARAARDALVSLAAEGSRRSEALYFLALSSRDAGDIAGFLRLARRVADEYPSENWAEAALYSLADYHVKHDDDDRADALFREQYERFPRGIYAERAAWKVGWRSYRQGRYAESARYFERGSYDFPRSDFRPAWLYWSGRAHERLGERGVAEERYVLCLADYLNTYHGRLSAKRLGRDAPSRALALSAGVAAGDILLLPDPPPNAAIIRGLLEAGLYDDAANELKYAQRVWGDSSALQATLAWTNQQQAFGKSGVEQFELLRGAINQMKRAYPQMLTAGGDALPRDVQTVIFPLYHWDLIRTQAVANGLDPYMVAALVAQESTFVADIRSHANAWGLMQLLPGTAQEWARKLNLRYSTSLLTRPESNVRMGTAVFAERIRQFDGGVHLALASYNAGPTPVRRWIAERPGLETEEFIDDIPYPETQNYVRKILATTEDYRRLYGNETRASR